MNPPPLFTLDDPPPPQSPERPFTPKTRSTKPSKTTVHLAGARSHAVAALADLEPGECRHIVSQADWSTHHLIDAALDLTGPADLHLATWSASEDAIRMLLGWLADGRLRSVTALLDWRVKVRRPEAMQLARANFARLRVANCHAKLFVLSAGAGAHEAITIVGSANLTANPRIEAAVAHSSPTVADFHREWLESELAGAKPFDEPDGDPGDDD